MNKTLMALQEQDLGEIENRCVRALGDVERESEAWRIVIMDIPRLLRDLRLAYMEMADMTEEIKRLRGLVSAPPPPAAEREGDGS